MPPPRSDTSIRRPRPLLKAYRAENAAAVERPAPLLDGSLHAAQAYVDRITRSAWWRKNARPVLRPLKTERVVLVLAGRGGGSFAGNAWRDWRGTRVRWMRLGTVQGARPAHISDPWMILHELAHLMAPNGEGHGTVFAAHYVKLVRRWLGPQHAAALRRSMDAHGLKRARLTRSVA